MCLATRDKICLGWMTIKSLACADGVISRFFFRIWPTIPKHEIQASTFVSILSQPHACINLRLLQTSLPPPPLKHILRPKDDPNFDDGS